MTTNWQKGICNEKSGFLFSHPCDRLPRGNCSQCEKPICSDHSHLLEDHADAAICTSCAKEAKKINRKHQRRGRYYGDDFYDDPYFYGPRYGWYWDRRRRHHDHDHDEYDFTEADAESLQNVGEYEFENDMTES